MQSWTVVVPVKLLESAKTRLAREDRAALALAMAADTVAAASACAAVASVLVVTDDVRAAAALAGAADVVPDVPARGLNPALAHGAHVAAGRRPSDGIVALAADLPSLTAHHLEIALTAAEGVARGLVADAVGKGTVLLSAAPGIALEPRFGADSRVAHRAAGVIDLTDDLGDTVRGLRRDVDTLDDLQDARRIGLGPATVRVLHGSGAVHVQATVRDWDEQSASGTAVTDDGTLVALAPGSRLAGSLRRLRPGQRVRVTRSGENSRVIGLVTESVECELG
ncbi:MAG TPA: 2-phospho-L-lactate guanylyltransferase [Frankiaceae bacterium]|nr:2-phospho-L-lactate guanylyltransferase [Frankiaceae bacterium]